jgi:hypothetical protein
LWAFAAWRQALPWLPTTRLAQESVSTLIEMLADDVALKTESKATLIKAIAIVASGPAGVPGGRVAFNGGDLPSGEAGAAGISTAGISAAGMVDAGLQGSPGSASSAGTTMSRVRRLLSPQEPLPAPLRALVLAGCLLLLAVPTALLIVPGLLG